MDSKSTLRLLLCLGALFPSACTCSSGGSFGGGGLDEGDWDFDWDGALTGLVSNVNGGPLDEYVNLTFTGKGSGKVTTAQAKPDGTYYRGLDFGFYEVTSRRPGYFDFTVADVYVTWPFTELDIEMIPIPAGEYIGASDCATCHAEEFEAVSRSGHAFVVNEIESGKAPSFPFTSLAGVRKLIDDDDSDPDDPLGGTDNTLGTPQSWADVSYVLGGYAWKANFMDQDGFLITGSEVQFDHFDEEMSAYHDNEVDKPYDCGNCHTTGWRHEDPFSNPDRQDGRPGIDGNWAFAGVQCESCHGAGSRHARTMNPAHIERFAAPRSTEDFLNGEMAYGKAVACGECHTRDGERDYPTYVSAFDQARMDAGQPVEPEGGRVAAVGGLVGNHEQFDELLGIDPDDPALASTRSAAFLAAHGKCHTCHDPHTTTVFADQSGDPPGVHTDCTSCHADKVIAQGGMQDLLCVDCHMPAMARSATLTFDPAPGDERPPLGDVTSHTFAIDLNRDPETEQFTPGGDFAYPWITGKWACKTCHSPTGSSFDIDFPSALTIHD